MKVADSLCEQFQFVNSLLAFLGAEGQNARAKVDTTSNKNGCISFYKNGNLILGDYVFANFSLQTCTLKIPKTMSKLGLSLRTNILLRQLALLCCGDTRKCVNSLIVDA